MSIVMEYAYLAAVVLCYGVAIGLLQRSKTNASTLPGILFILVGIAITLNFGFHLGKTAALGKPLPINKLHKEKNWSVEARTSQYAIVYGVGDVRLVGFDTTPPEWFKVEDGNIVDLEKDE